LEESGRFTVDVATTPQKPPLPPEPGSDSDAELAKYKAALAKYADDYAAWRKAWAGFNPDLTKYDVVLSNYNGLQWSKAFQQSLESALREGKVGLVIVHAANNAFGGWNEYNLMIGMGWRGANGGERLKLDEKGQPVRVPSGKGDGSGHRYTGE